ASRRPVHTPFISCLGAGPPVPASFNLSYKLFVPPTNLSYEPLLSPAPAWPISIGAKMPAAIRPMMSLANGFRIRAPFSGGREFFAKNSQIIIDRNDLRFRRLTAPAVQVMLRPIMKGNSRLRRDSLKNRRLKIELSNSRRTAKMRNYLVAAVVGLAAAFASAAPAMAQAGAGLNNNMYNKLKESGPGGPAPKHDLTGSWAGPVTAQKGDDPSLTPEGQKLFDMNKPEAKFHVAGTNDAFARTCDPLGFPRNIIFEIRGLSFATMPDRVIILNQYQRAWREVWTDGRELPKNVGGTGKDAPDPRYYGYSVGHWEGVNTFVVDTTGLDDKT